MRSALPYKFRTTPTTSDLLYVVATQEKGRLQATCLTGSLEPYDVLIRSIQGHSGDIDKQMNPERAHTQVWNRKDLPILAHHTKTELLQSIIGIDAPGLLPGGIHRMPTVNGRRGRRSTAPRP